MTFTYTLHLYCIHRFRCDRKSGAITVAPCGSPGSENCLDAEGTSLYSLTLIAADQSGEKFTTLVPLEITVTDDNDNSPKFDIPTYVSYITEGETVPEPPIQVQVSVRPTHTSTGECQNHPYKYR